MVVSFNIYEVLSVINLIVCLVYFPFIFFRRNETWNRVLRLSLMSVSMLINLFQIPMEVQMGKSYVLSIVIVILWFSNALMTTFDLGKNSY